MNPGDCVNCEYKPCERENAEKPCRMCAPTAEEERTGDIATEEINRAYDRAMQNTLKRIDVQDIFTKVMCVYDASRSKVYDGETECPLKRPCPAIEFVELYFGDIVRRYKKELLKQITSAGKRAERRIRKENL